MIPNVKEKVEEVKKIWLEKKDAMTTSQLYKQFLGDYFDVANWSINQKDWLFFLIWIRDWKKAIKAEKKEEDISQELEKLTDEEIELVQERNRKRMILILRDLIENYKTLEDPIRKALTIGEVRRMYNAIQSLEEKMKMTEISRGKLKLEAVKTLLPYQRMSLMEILQLKQKLNESFDRIIKLKSGEPVGQDTPANG